MLFLKDIQLIQFRNYLNQNFSFSEKVIGICGKNGTGKTNLLDSIYYLSFCKSYFSRSDSSNSTHNFKGFRIDGNFILNNKEILISAIHRENNKKEFYFNNQEYDKFSKHIGILPSVMVAPDDIEIITGASEIRRKFIDIILSQTQEKYIQYAIDYNSILTQRNSLLKQQNIDFNLLDILTYQLVQKGEFIFEKRHSFLINFLKYVTINYQKISNTDETVCCNYISQLTNNNFIELINNSLQNDIFIQRTTCGIHKDDIEFQLNDIKFKTEASQGQRKSLLFALKLTEWQWLKQHKGFSPILLLDDVFEKLDEERMKNLLDIVIEEDDAQIFITDTHLERLNYHLNKLNKSYKIIQV